MSESSSSHLMKEPSCQVELCFSEAAWYVIYTYCHHEVRVEERLRQ